MRKPLVLGIVICLSILQPHEAIAEEVDDRLLWYGVGIGTVAVLCDLFQNDLISKEVLDQKLSSVQDPDPNVDTEVIAEAIVEMRKSGDFKGCL